MIEAVASGRWDQSSIWSSGTIPGSTDSVLIDGFSVDVNSFTGSRTVAYLELRNTNPLSNSPSRLFVEDILVGVPVTLTVNGDFVASLENENKDVAVYLAFGGRLLVKGNGHFTRSADHTFNKRLLLEILNSSEATFNGNFVYDYKTLVSSENEDEITIDNAGVFTVGGTTSLYQRGGKNFNFHTWNGAQINLGDSLYVEMSGGEKMDFHLHDNVAFTVGGNATIKNMGCSIELIFKLHNSAQLVVDGDLNLISTANNYLVKIDALNNNVVDVSGDVTMDAQTEEDIFFYVKETSRLELEGAITRKGTNSYGNFWMDATASLLLNGTITSQEFPEEKKPGSGMDYFLFTNIILDNEAGFTLTDTLEIEDELLLVKGNMVTDASNILIIKEGATISGGSAEAFVDGPMIKLGATATPFEFPVGDNGIYAPIEISRVMDSNAEIKAEFLADPPPWGNITIDPDLDNVLESQRWKLDRNAASGEFEVTLNWNNATELGITNPDSMVVASLNDMNVLTNYGNGAVTSSGESGSITSADPPPWGNIFYTLGSVSPINALPVELLNFNAIPRAKSILIEWETELELNTDRFEIERSLDGRNFNKIGVINSQGEGSGISSYSMNDKTPNAGMNYYRLRILDNDGAFEYSPVEAVRFEADSKLMIYPNPVQDLLNIQGDDFSSEEGTLEVFDKNGQRLYHGIIAFQSGNFQIETDKINVLNHGTYFLRVTQASQSSVLKFIKLQ